MSTSVISPKGKVRVFACGGAGYNVAAQLEKIRNENNAGFATLDIAYIDTSRSNTRGDIDPAHHYYLDGLDGSGKIRSENHAVISEHILQILQQFKPTDLNIVLSSAGGGSGSVIGPLLTSELIAMEAPTIVMAIGSADTRLEAENTLKTIKSYEAIARMRQVPVVMTYVENTTSTSRAEIDSTVISMILALCVLFSRENREMDSRDLFNFLRFDRSTCYTSTYLATLVMLDDLSQLNTLGNIISVATLAKTGHNTALPNMPEYQCVGYVSNEANNNVVGDKPTHFITSEGILNEATSHLSDILKDVAQAHSARVKKAGVLTKEDRPIDTGLVL